jgi:hypothetical protein
MPKNWTGHRHPHTPGSHAHNTHEPPDMGMAGKRMALGNAISEAAGNNTSLIALLADPEAKVGAGITLAQIKRLIFQDAAGGGEGTADDRDIRVGLLNRVLSSHSGDPKDRDGLMCGCGG